MKLPKWIGDLFAPHGKPVSPFPSPPSRETIENLINKTINRKPIANENEDHENIERNHEDSEDYRSPFLNDKEDSGSADSAGGDNHDTTTRKAGCCPYRLKRNIVASISEVRGFMQANNIDERAIREILTAIAEIVASVSEGKITAAILLLILK